MRKPSPAVLFALLVLLVSMCSSLRAEPVAGEFVFDESHDKFYRPDVYHLPNGFQVVLKHRPEVQKVSIRMVVELGMDHFPCTQQELPHVLEHMLFEGSAQYSNSELEQRVADHGASWNATTDLFHTSYDFEIYAPYLAFALDTLYDMLVHSTMDQAAMQRAIDSAWIESDNRGDIKRFWQSLDFGAAGSEQLYSDMGMYCESEDDPYGFSHDDLLEAFRNYYQPGNISLVLVGNFDDSTVRSLVADRFGKIPAAPTLDAEVKFRWQKPRAQRYTSGTRLAFGDTADVGIVWLTGGYRGKEYTSLKLLKHYLSTRLYTLLRNEHQLSYSPNADGLMYEDQGVFYLQADTQMGSEEQVLELMRGELDRILADGLTTTEYTQLQRSLLIGSVMEDLDNFDTADYYAGSLFELADGNGFWNYERLVLALDYSTFIASLREFFAQQRGAEYVDRATFDSKTLLALCLALAGLVIVLLLVGYRLTRSRAGR